MAETPDYMIVEDGSAKTDSNAYWDIDSVTLYLRSKGAMDWSNYTLDQQARAIISATYYIEKRFKRRYRGLRQSVEQALGWPRIGAFDDDAFTIFGIPSQIKWAVAEYAIRAARIGVLAPDPIRMVPDQDLSQPKAGLTPGTATLTTTGNFADTETVTIGTRVYTFQMTLTAVDGHVLIGADAAASLLNLQHAINDSGGTAGTDYFVTQADPYVVAQATPATLVIESVQANANSLATTDTAANASWGHATVTGYSNNPSDPNLILGPVRTKSEKIGPLEESTTYDGLAARSVIDERTTRSAQSGIVNDYNIPEYPEADLWIEQIVRNPATGTRLIRGS